MESSILEDELTEDKAKIDLSQEILFIIFKRNILSQRYPKPKIYQIGIEYTYPIHKLVYNRHNLNTSHLQDYFQLKALNENHKDHYVLNQI